MRYFFIFFSILLLACQGGDTTGGTETGNAFEKNIGAVVGSLFGEEDQSAGLLALLVREAQAQVDRPPFCEWIEEENNDEGITFSGQVTAGTYGKSGSSVTVTSQDGCSEGGTFASFFVQFKEMDCTGEDNESFTLTMENCSGVFREDTTLQITQIYGTFTMTSGSETATDIRCSFTIPYSNEGGGEQLSGSCEDSDGNEIEQSNDTTCAAD